ncbi:proton-translocating NADH-quinone oxidoreductase, chain M [Emticicia oligotrophica DSM 17448]|uniref:Proton-translocating NADH-quinone oxidoreductase, chain M n=1 Tax=Emticicia oligotrophica (strain DSM 17448 / CIP 109782 / MTCC 6937 / GPTSA100-15) TaxID=929562 RepID=A0ABM5MZV6_EMTOG|nr:NADH-quinone oxidoreductase subunit M [Emticicia oligotrophica]AFK02628.1 proton-translocating NADH-quinone oxidoreductase, chain M [Emticicia oligotrophica DSM 17448]
MLALTLILIPLIGSLVLLLLKGSSVSTSKNTALVASLATFAVAIYSFLTFDAQSSIGVKYSWMKDLNINFHIAIDGISILMVLLTAFLVPIIITSTFKHTYKNHASFYALILLAETALMGVFMARDIFLFYFFYEAALIPVYFIAALWGGQNAPRITFKMFVYTIFGSLFMLVAIVFLYIKGASADINQLVTTAKLLTPSTQNMLFWAFFIAFAIKMPVLPFHTWQPDAYSESPTPATMLLSGLLSKMGVYGLIRIMLPLSPAGVANWGLYGMILAVVGLIYGSIIAIQQNNIKRLIAYSSFAHMGLMAAGVLSGNINGIQGALLQMVAHGVNAVGLFFIVKVIYDRTGTRDLSALGGITQKTPALSIYFMIIMLGSVALPLTNGFVGEFLLLKGVYDKDACLGIFAGLTIILGAVYMLRLMQRSMFGEANEITAKFKDVSGSEIAVLLPIATVVIITGLFPNVFLKVTEPAVNLLLQMLK